MVRRNPQKSPESKILGANELTIAIQKLDRRIKDIESFDVKGVAERFDAKPEALKDKINQTLADIFGYDTVEYKKYEISSFDTLPSIVGEKFSLFEIQQNYQKGISDTITKLSSLKEILIEKLQDIKQNSPLYSKPIETTSVNNTEIFIVHGHDDEAKMELEQFVTEIGLTPIILHRKPDEGLTIIEKFEKHSKVEFALILLTPDDEVRDSNGKIIKRARQNVIFEMGFFVGKLGRDRVCCLRKEDIEIPSDISGVIYKPFKSKIDEVKYAVITELKAAGYKLKI
ncbi:MAG: nucleotide-binding protein [Sedimentisphaerales bacterium]